MAEQASLFGAPARPESDRRASAIFSDCANRGIHFCAPDCIGRLYRYVLRWPTGHESSERIVLWVLANPSTASAEKTDPTIAKCIKYSRTWGFGWCHVVNVRAWRSTDPDALPADPHAIGPDNEDHIRVEAASAELVVCGFGKLGGDQGWRTLELIRQFAVPHALKLNKDGSPQHPLYIADAATPFPMEARHG